MAKIPCRFPACPNLLSQPGFCHTHSKHSKRKHKDADKRRMQDEDNAFAFKFRSSRAWKRVRKVKLSMNPICEDPFGNHRKARTTASGDQVHHIKSIKDCPDMRLELSNLMTVCFKCHARFNAEERAKG